MTEKTNSVLPKKSKNYRGIKIITLSTTIFIGLISIYEYTLIKNPFFDPVPPYLVWMGMAAVCITFLYRLFQATANEK